MAHGDTDKAMEQENISSGEKLTLLAIAHHRNNRTGACFPGEERLAKITGYSSRSIKRNIKKLREKEIITVRKSRSHSGYARNNYEFCWNYRDDRLSPEADKISSGKGQNVLNPMTECPPNLESSTRKEEKGKEPAGASPASPQKKDFSLKDKEKEDSKEDNSNSKKGEGIESLVDQFKRLVKEHHGQSYFDFSKKEIGQLDVFAQKMEEIDIDPTEIMSFLIADWFYFSKFAKDHSGAYSLSEIPQPGFLLYWRNACVSYFQTHSGDNDETDEDDLMQPVGWDEEPATKYVEAPPDPPLMDFDLLKDM